MTPGPLDPGPTGCLPACADGAPLLDDMFRNLEWFIWPVQRRACLFDLLGTERRTVCFFGPLPVRSTKADHSAAGDQRRTIVIAGAFNRCCDRFGIVAVDTAGQPARCPETRNLVIRTGQRCRPVDRDLVVVEQHDQLVEPKMPGQRNRFVAEALHQAAVPGNHIGIVIDEIVAIARVQQALGQRHADGRSDALPQRPGGRLDAGRMAILRMPRCLRSPLAECPEFVRCHALVSRQMQQRVQQHRAMSGRKHEPVAVRPCRVGRIKFQETRKQHRSDVSHAHRHAWVTRFGFFDGVDRQEADRVGHFRMLNIGTDGDGSECVKGHIVRLLRSISCRISGVRMSCIARSSFDP